MIELILKASDSNASLASYSIFAGCEREEKDGDDKVQLEPEGKARCRGSIGA